MRAERILVVVNRDCPCPALVDAVEERAAPGCHVHVLAPALNSLLRHFYSDLARALGRAQERLDAAAAALAGLDVRVTTELGDSVPLIAMDDALQDFSAQEIVIWTHPKGRGNWLERRLAARTAERFGLPVVFLARA